MNKRSVIRTIKNGRVKINGEFFVPEAIHQPYAGQLDGLRYVFGLYYGERWNNHFVNLVVSEVACGDPEVPRGPEMQNDGSLPWLFWENINRQTQG